MFKQIIKLIAVLNSKTNPSEIALGVVMGMYAGFLMGAPLILVIIFMLLVVLNANMSVFFLSIMIFKLLAFGVDFAGDKLGYAVLTMDAVKAAGASMMSMPLVPFTKFNYTVIMGNFIIALALTPLVWIASVKFVPFYRTKIQSKVEKFGIVKMIKASSAFKIYDSYKGE